MFVVMFFMYRYLEILNVDVFVDVDIVLVFCFKDFWVGWYYFCDKDYVCVVVFWFDIFWIFCVLLLFDYYGLLGFVIVYGLEFCGKELFGWIKVFFVLNGVIVV